MKKFYVYIHTCPNGKKYVGLITTEPKKRWGLNGAKYKSNKHFYRAIQKYDWNNISHQVFEVDTLKEMYYLEKYLIAYYHSNDPKYGYNKSEGGEKGPTGCKRSPEVKQRISDKLKGHKYSDEHNLKMRMSLKGMKKGIPLSEEHKNALKKPKAKQLWLTEEGKVVEMTLNNKNRFHPEWIQINK